MINNPVGINVDYINTKENIIADEISRVNRAVDAASFFQSLTQAYPQLSTCRRFHPSAELLSTIMEALLYGALTNPIVLAQQLQNNPGNFTSSPSIKMSPSPIT